MEYNRDYDVSQLPSQYKPLGAWTYFGYSLLFSIPLVGFILLIVFSCSNENINRRNYARSFFCVYAIVLILIAVLAITGGLTSVVSTLTSH